MSFTVEGRTGLGKRITDEIDLESPEKGFLGKSKKGLSVLCRSKLHGTQSKGDHQAVTLRLKYHTAIHPGNSSSCGQPNVSFIL